MAEVGAVPAKKSRSWNWLFWWRIDADELQRQVNEYATLRIHQSMRGICLLFMLFSAALSIALWALGLMEPWGFVDVGIGVGLGVLIFMGHSWAALGAMAYWTIEKSLALWSGVESYTPGRPPTASIQQVFWWAFYMHAFYFAYRIEKQRPPRTVSPTVPSAPAGRALEDIEKLAELRNKGFVTDEEFAAKKKQILGL